MQFSAWGWVAVQAERGGGGEGVLGDRKMMKINMIIDWLPIPL